MSKFRFIAKKIAERLFTNGNGIRATRLVLMDESGATARDLGGWCEESAIKEIEDQLNALLAVADVTPTNP
jgi:hypothetical protein